MKKNYLKFKILWCKNDNLTIVYGKKERSFAEKFKT